MRRNPDLVTVAALATFVVAGVFFFRFTADDAFIPARHGANLVEHGALVLNVGDRVSALTSPLHGLLCAAIYAAAGDATVLVWKVISALLVLGGVVSLMVTAARGPWQRATIAVFLLASSAVVLWTWGGLETPLGFFLVCAMMSLIASEPTPRRLTILFVLAGLAFLTRYDTVLFTVPVCAHAAWRHRKWSDVAFAAVVGAAAPVAWLLAAQRFYGDIFPTSYYIKAPNFADASRNAQYLGNWLVLTGAVPLGALAWFGRRGKRRRAKLRDRRWLGVFVGIVVLIAYGLGVATHHMMFSFRYFVPYLPALALLAAHGVDRVTERGGERVGWIVLGTFLVLQCLHVRYTFTSSLNGAVIGDWEYRSVGANAYATGFLHALLASGRQIREHWANTGKDRVPRIDTFAAGALPWACREAYVFEPLASYRPNTALRLGPGWRVIGAPVPDRKGRTPQLRIIDLMGAADYVHVLTPRHGTLERHLVKPVDEYELVARHDFVFDGEQEHMFVFYDPDPKDVQLPRALHGD